MPLPGLVAGVSSGVGRPSAEHRFRRSRPDVSGWMDSSCGAGNGDGAGDTTTGRCVFYTPATAWPHSRFAMRIS